MKKKIYIVDDEPKLGELFATVLRRDGFDAQPFVSTIPMLERIDQNEVPDVILTDLMMPGLNGIELIEALKDRKLSIPVIIMTAHSSVQTAVEAMRLGAFHYLQKPVNLEEMRTLLNKALELYDVKQELEEIKSTQRASYPITGILGESDAVARVRETIRTLRDVPNTIVLVRGETGTGKNLVAKTIHFNSVYNAGRFMEINCAALPDNLLEAELFGYEKGAFTDARASKPGLLEVADGGTVFLDEIDSMSIALQAKLLSFLESRTFRRLGGVEDLRVTTRILCATNSNLEESVAARKFRKDLFFRINVVNMHLPPLRTMGRDLLLIAAEIVKTFNRELGRDVKGFTPAAEEKLIGHPWPGNVRELRNVLERAMIFARNSSIDAPDLILGTIGELEEENYSDDLFRFEAGGSLEELECAYIRHILQRSRTSYGDVAQLLGISKKTLWDKRKRYNLDEATARVYN
ncbi:MAG TPA: sigma-54 dependent transcriptional regulator [Rhodothermales bacterium]|nr:sigma-54 dependent transcriptional regulator [Rhodothermales bacterium]